MNTACTPSPARGRLSASMNDDDVAKLITILWSGCDGGVCFQYGSYSPKCYALGNDVVVFYGNRGVAID